MIGISEMLFIPQYFLDIFTTNFFRILDLLEYLRKQSQESEMVKEIYRKSVTSSTDLINSAAKALGGCPKTNIPLDSYLTIISNRISSFENSLRAYDFFSVLIAFFILSYLANFILLILCKVLSAICKYLKFYESLCNQL